MRISFEEEQKKNIKTQQRHNNNNKKKTRNKFFGRHSFYEDFQNSLFLFFYKSLLERQYNKCPIMKSRTTNACAVSVRLPATRIVVVWCYFSAVVFSS